MQGKYPEEHEVLQQMNARYLGIQQTKEAMKDQEKLQKQYYQDQLEEEHEHGVVMRDLGPNLNSSGPGGNPTLLFAKVENEDCPEEGKKEMEIYHKDVWGNGVNTHFFTTLRPLNIEKALIAHLDDLA